MDGPLLHNVLTTSVLVCLPSFFRRSGTFLSSGKSGPDGQRENLGDDHMGLSFVEYFSFTPGVSVVGS